MLRADINFQFHRSYSELKLFPVTEGNSKDKKKKKSKDPNQPKKPLSAFFLFSNEKRASIKTEFPDFSIGELCSLKHSANPCQRKRKRDFSYRDNQPNCRMLLSFGRVEWGKVGQQGKVGHFTKHQFYKKVK